MAMPIKDPERRREANRERMRRKRAEGVAWIDPEKERARKAQWYYEQGGKERRLINDRRRRELLQEDKLSKIHP